jgi:glucosamine kinase
MKLIIDSGSTKSDWCFLNGDDVVLSVTSQGINPFHQNRDGICSIIDEELIPSIEIIDINDVKDVFFYGAGCATDAVCVEIKEILSFYFSGALIFVASDMLGAARALCGNKDGIACVLGTGSNSCIYDGKVIVDQIPSLGYILGDEGSSSALGKRLLSDCLKRQLPESVSNEFLERYNLSMDIILENVYRKPVPNRYIANFTPFLFEKKLIPDIHDLLIHCFTDFFKRNVVNYHRPWLPVNFVGSIASNFSDELIETAESLGMKTGMFLKSPIEGLVRYHCNKINSL